MQLKSTLLLLSSPLILGTLPLVATATTFSLQNASITDIKAAFDAGALNSQQLTQLYINRIQAFDQQGPKLNSVAVLNPNALTDAKRLDELKATGTILGPLHGVPVLIKDSYNVKGLTTTNGVGVFTTLNAVDDSFSVAQLRNAGAVILGKANMSTWAFSYDGTSESYGPVINPYGSDRTPGGSSSGSGVAAAASFATFTMGGETGGSIRVPSTHNALVGIKPSAGLISVNQTWPLATERDVLGPMAKTVTDIAFALDALVKYDPANIWNPYIPKKTRPLTYTTLSDTAMQGKVIGLPRAYIGKGDPALGQSFPLDPEVSAAFEQAKAVLQAQGATLVEVDIPAHTTWYIDTNEGDTLPGYPSPRNQRDLLSRSFYYEQQVQGYQDEAIRSFVDLVSLVPRSNPFYAWVVYNAVPISTGLSKPWEQLPSVSQALRAIAVLRTTEYENFMAANGIDAFVFPTLNYIAPPQGDAGNQVYALYGTLPANFEANILGVPAVTVPMGYSKDGLPLSLEFMGNYFGEPEILGYAYDYEQATKFRRSPTSTPALPGEDFDY
jgi:amidase